LYDAAIIILDEIDQLVDSDDDGGVLMQLTRAKESGKIDSNLGVVAISNKISYRDSLNERVKSSLGDDELVFSPYDGNQLQAIMDARTDAFCEGVLDSAVIPKTAALAAREHGMPGGLSEFYGTQATSRRKKEPSGFGKTMSTAPRNAPRPTASVSCWPGSRRTRSTFCLRWRTSMPKTTPARNSVPQMSMRPTRHFAR